MQNALDLIEYANGDPKVNPWAALRAEVGHPEPFKGFGFGCKVGPQTRLPSV